MLVLGIGYYLWPMLTTSNVMMIFIALGIIGLTVGAIINQSSKNNSQEL